MENGSCGDVRWLLDGKSDSGCEGCGGKAVEKKNKRIFAAKFAILQTKFTIFDRCSDRVGRLTSFTADSSCQLNIFRHNCHSFRMNRTQVCIFKKTN